MFLVAHGTSFSSGPLCVKEIMKSCWHHYYEYLDCDAAAEMTMPGVSSLWFDSRA